MRVVLTQALEPSAPVEVMYWPLGLGYLAAYARQRSDNTDFVYAEGEEGILAADPDVIGITAITETFEKAVSLCKKLRKDFSGPIILGGVHTSAMPSSLPAEADVGVIGEGEETFARLLELIQTRGREWKDDLAHIQGICLHGPDGIVVTEPQEPIAELDTIPFPDRAMLDEGWTHVAENQGAYSLFSSRGCPYDCRFCFSTQFWKKIRRHSAAYVVDEALKVKEEYSATSLNLLDDLFISDRSRLYEIATRIRGSGLADEVAFSCTIRSNEIDGRVCESLVKMNVGLVTIGLESGSDDILRLMQKRTTVEKHERALAMLSDYGIKIVGSFILGFPGETVRDMDLTVDFIDRHLGSDLEEFEVYPAVPYPGTWLWHHSVKEGILAGDEVSGRGFGVAEATFDPVNYRLLNNSVPRETFLRYYYQLKCSCYRSQLARRLQVIKDLRDRLSSIAVASCSFDLDCENSALRREIKRAQEHLRFVEGDNAAMKGELARASAHIERLERLLGERGV